MPSTEVAGESGQNLFLFLRISEILTGFSRIELESTGMVISYFNTILQNTSLENVAFFFVSVREQAIAPNFMPCSSYGGLTQELITLWYTSYWGGMVVSDDAFRQELMWTAGHTHPSGAKQPGFGSWAIAPLTTVTTKPEKL